MKLNLFLKKNAPTIMVWLGLGGVCYGTYKACQATRKLDPIIEEHKATKDVIECSKTFGTNTLEENSQKYTEEDAKKDTAKLYVRTATNIAKLYFVPTVVMGTSFGCILGSHNILTKRNAALGAAYATLDSMFKKYKEEITKKYGDEINKEILYGIKAEKIKGEKEAKTYKMTEKTNLQPSYYGRFFDETNPCWEPDPEYRLLFLKRQQDYMNDRLKAKGIIFLNEVYEALGFKPTRAGQIVGWVYDPDRTDIDNFIDFGIYDVKNSTKREFVNGIEQAILLDFNVDGNVLDLIK